MGLVGWAFTEGVSAYWIIPGCLIGFIFNWFVIAKPLRNRSKALEAITIPDFLSKSSHEDSNWIRASTVFIILIAMLLYVAAQFSAAGKSFSASFTEMNYQTGVIIGASIVLVYTCVGGFRAVCWTDFIQAFLMVFCFDRFSSLSAHL